jgi:hypothetical protein
MVRANPDFSSLHPGYGLLDTTLAEATLQIKNQ